ncbi:hypothetical protein H4S06_000277 [Coemansia sp. BCRC 34490]|nr:hypothetical protein H4S06_000277 [Coemansia sp. BCRC 34490]
MASTTAASVADIEIYTDKASVGNAADEQLVDILHDQVNDNTSLRISDKRFSTARRNTPSYSKLLAISNTYGYVVAGTPDGLSVFTTADAMEALSKGASKGTNTAVTLDSRKTISLAAFGGKPPTHVDISADELHVIVATSNGQVLVFSASSLMQGSSATERSIAVGSGLRDLRANPLDAPTTAAALTLSGELLALDISDGSFKSLFKPQKDEERITSICWSRKGKQIVCGDVSATLTQRLPADGTAKRVIAPQMDDGNILGEFSALAVDWIDTYTFFVVYGLFPEGGFEAGNGGGVGAGEDELEDNMTAAYVVTQEKSKAPMQWMYIEDPCSSMMCPERYPGFQIACISNWGASAKNIVIMAGTSSDATMTIGCAATRKAADGGADESSAEWAQWDIDGSMAVMPLSAVAAEDDSNTETYPIGIAIDYTSTNDLPPLADDGKRVDPVPILWMLNTDGCMLAYHVYNVFEMRNGGKCPDMVPSTKKLPGVSLGGLETSPESTAASGGMVAAFATKPAGNAGFGGAFGSSGVSGSSAASGLGFGKVSASSMSKGPSAAGVTGQPTFGGASKPGASSGFGGFGGFGSAALGVSSGEGKSIFDVSSNEPSIFDAPSGASSDSLAGMFKPYAPATKDVGKPPISSSLGGAFGARPKNSLPNVSEPSKPTANTLGGSSAFGGFGASMAASLNHSDTQKTEAPKPTTGAFGGSSAFGGFGAGMAASLTSSDKDKTEAPKPTTGVFGGSSTFGGFGQAAYASVPAAAKEPKEPPMTSGFSSQRLAGFPKDPTSRAPELPWSTRASLRSPFGKAADSSESASPEQTPSLSFPKAGNTPDLQAQQQAAEKERQEKEKAERVRQAELRIEQEKKEAMQRELEMKAADVIKKQYILTCNRFDRELKAFGTSLRKTESAIEQVRSSRLPPISIDPSVEQLAPLTRRMDEMSIDDSNAWNTVADCLLEALQVSRNELKASQKLLSKQVSNQLKMETKREEISRILESSMSTHSTSNSTFDGGLNPMQRDYQRRLRRAFDMIGKRTKDVEQVVDIEAERLESRYRNLPLVLRAPTADSIQRTLSNVAQTLEQKNEELTTLAARVDAIDLGSGRSGASRSNRGSRPRKRPSFSNSLPSEEGAARRSSQAAGAGGTPATPSVLLRTAAGGTPWSPHDLPLSSPASGRLRRGFGLLPEDLVASDASATKDTDDIGTQSATRTNPLFPNAKVRELVPRSSKNIRKTSIVIDGETGIHGFGNDDAASTVSGFSNAAAYAQARKHRSLVHDVLTRNSRSMAVFRTPESAVSNAYKLGDSLASDILKRQPMPNLERYVRVFGRLKIDESEYESEYESEPDQEHPTTEEPPVPVFGESEETPILKRMQNSLHQQQPSGSTTQQAEPISVGMFGMPLQALPAPVAGSFKQRPRAEGDLFGMLQQRTLEEEFKPLEPSSGMFGMYSSSPSLDVQPFKSGEGISAGKQSLSSDIQFSKTLIPQPAESAPASKPGSASTGVFGAFKPSGSLSFGSSQPAASVSSSKKPIPSSTDTAKSVFGLGSSQSKALQGGEWTCEVCELKSPQSAAKCIVCDAAKPGASPAEVSKATSPVPSFGGFKPSGGLSFGSLSLAPVKPAAEPLEKHDKPSTVQISEFKPSGSLSLGSGLLQGTAGTKSVSDSDSDLENASAVGSLEENSSDFTDYESELEDKEDSDSRLGHISEATSEKDASDAIPEQPGSDIVPEAATSDSAAEKPEISFVEPVPASKDSESVPEEPVNEVETKSEVSQSYSSVVKAGISDDEDAGHGVQSLDSEDDIKASDDESAVNVGSKDEAGEPNQQDISIAEDKPEHKDEEAATSADSKLGEKPGLDHDSDGFVHVSQSEPGHDNSEDLVNSAEGTEATADAAESALSLPQLAATQIIDELGQQLSGIGADALVDCVFGLVKKDASAGAAHDGLEDKEVDKTSQIDPSSSSVRNTDLPEPSASDEFVLLSKTESIENVAASGNTKTEPSSNSKSSFWLGDISRDIDSVAAADKVSDPQPDAQSTAASSASSAISLLQHGTEPQPEQQANLGASSFFKSGRLGSFGAFGSKKFTSSNQGAPLSTAGSNGGGALPNAFSSGLQKTAASSSAFGTKLDRPAFGVASMSSFEANKRISSGIGKDQGSFTSMSGISSGFGAHGSSSINPFAEFRKANSESPAGVGLDDATDVSSVFSLRSKEASPDIAIRPQNSSKKNPAISSDSEPDPIRDIINNHGTDDDHSTSDANAYDNESD